MFLRSCKETLMSKKPMLHNSIWTKRTMISPRYLHSGNGRGRLEKSISRRCDQRPGFKCCNLISWALYQVPGHTEIDYYHTSTMIHEDVGRRILLQKTQTTATNFFRWDLSTTTISTSDLQHILRCSAHSQPTLHVTQTRTPALESIPQQNPWVFFTHDQRRVTM